MKALTTSLVVALALTALLAGSAIAQPTLGRPGSVLVFPLFDSDMGNTLITVTNTNEDESFCFPPGVWRNGDIKIQYFYIDGETWECTDLCEYLSPSDTITVATAQHNPNMENGFLIVQALDPHTGAPVDYDHLIGSAVVVDTEFDFQWSYLPYSFEGKAKAGDWDNVDPCGRRIIPYDGNCIVFDGIHYASFPDRLYLDNFFGEGMADGVNVEFGNTLYLLSTNPPPANPNESGNTSVKMVGYNNNERRFSRTFRFNCWIATSLGELTGSASQANLAVGGDDEELSGVATGWLRLDTVDENVGILGVFRHSADTALNAGHSLQFDNLPSFGPGKSVRLCCGF